MDRGKSNKNAILSGLGARAALTEISKAASQGDRMEMPESCAFRRQRY